MFKLLKSTFSKVADAFKTKEKDLEEAEQEGKVIIADPSLKSKLKSLLKEKFYLSEHDLKETKEKFELVLLQSDFSVEVVDDILNKFIDDLRDGLQKGKNLDKQLKEKFIALLFELLPEKKRYFV